MTARRVFAAWDAVGWNIFAVVMGMREQSAREAFASRPDDDRRRLAIELWDAHRAGLPMWCLGVHSAFPINGHHHVPFALIGCAAPPGDDIGSMLWLATDVWPRIAIPSHRWWRRWFVPNVLSRYRRVEFLGGADEASRRWCQSVGFTPEGIAYRHGKAGEDFVRFAWTNPNWSPQK